MFFDDFWRRTSLAFCLWLIFGFIQNVPRAEAALIALPSGEAHSLLWERVLVVYDSLSKQQTVIGESAISGSPSQFAILIATPKTAVINYTTTRIWRKLSQYIKVPSRKTRALDLSVYSWLWTHFGFQTENTHKRSDKIDVLKSRDTQVHIQERALHEWLISRGLSLSPEQALSIKNVYQSGFSVTALHVRPRRSNKEVLADETWTSTWIFSHEVDEPYYVSILPSESGLLNSKRTQLHRHDLSNKTSHHSKPDFTSEQSQGRGPTQSQLRLSFISDQTLRPYHQSISETEEEVIRGITKTLSRIQLKTLNQSLNAQNWSFNRRGVLSHFKLISPLGVQQIRAVVTDEKQIIMPKPQLKIQKYKLAMPLEFLLMAMLALIYILKKKS